MCFEMWAKKAGDLRSPLHGNIDLSIIFFAVEFWNKVLSGGGAALDKALETVFVHGVNDGVILES